MKKSLFRIAMLTMAAVSLFSLPALAENRPATTTDVSEKIVTDRIIPDLLYRDGMRGPQQRILLYRRIADYLELSPAQERHIQPLLKKYRQGYLDFRGVCKERLENVVGASQVRDVDYSKISIAQRNQMRQIIRECIYDGKQAVEDFRADIEQFLTPEQRDKMSKLVVNWLDNTIHYKDGDALTPIENKHTNTVTFEQVDRLAAHADSVNDADANASSTNNVNAKDASQNPDYAIPKAPPLPPPPEMVVRALNKRLDLTKEQQDKILEIMNKNGEELAKSILELRDKYKNLEGKDVKPGKPCPKACDKNCAPADKQGDKACDKKCATADKQCDKACDKKCAPADKQCDKACDKKCATADKQCDKACDKKCATADKQCDKACDKKCAPTDKQCTNQCDKMGKECQDKHGPRGERAAFGREVRKVVAAEREKAINEINAVLTPEQREKFKAIQNEHPMARPIGHGPQDGMHRPPMPPEGVDGKCPPPPPPEGVDGKCPPPPPPEGVDGKCPPPPPPSVDGKCPPPLPEDKKGKCPSATSSDSKKEVTAE